MIHEQVELHNVAELHYESRRGGHRLQRVPEDIRTRLNDGAQLRMLQPDNAEIRYVSSGSARVALSSHGRTRVSVFHGSFDGRQRAIIGPERTTIDIAPPARLLALSTQHTGRLPFDPRVVRLILGGPDRDPVLFHGVNGTDVRPPTATEVPALRYLAYGTSITHGFDAEGPHLTYVGHTARRLGADLINLGVGGSAFCEPELADYIAARPDSQIASLALSVNMHGVPLSDFRTRVQYMVERLAGANPQRPVACITLFPYWRDLGVKETEDDATFGGAAEEYRQSLRDAVAASGLANAHLIEGPDILTDISGLTADLVHPEDYGMLEMGERLAARLSSFLPGS